MKKADTNGVHELRRATDFRSGLQNLYYWCGCQVLIKRSPAEQQLLGLLIVDKFCCNRSALRPDERLRHTGLVHDRRNDVALELRYAGLCSEKSVF